MENFQYSDICVIYRLKVSLCCTLDRHLFHTQPSISISICVVDVSCQQNIAASKGHESVIRK